MNISELFGVNAPKVYKHKVAVACSNPELIIGFELETENLNPDLNYGDLARRNNIKIENDGSLRGNAYEFITYPMRSDHALGAVQTFFNEAKFTPANYSDRCSVHVHVNCTDMTTEQVSTLALCYVAVEELLFKFVGGNRDSNIYCIPWSHCRSHLDLVTKFLTSGDFLRGWSKYTALNLLPLKSQGTVEFRQMPGTCDMQKLTTWVNIIGSLFKFAKEVDLKDLITEIKNLNTNSQYEAFFARLLGNNLPYNNEYAQELEAGIIQAKYSLLGYGKGKKADLQVATMEEIQELIARQQVALNARANEAILARFNANAAAARDFRQANVVGPRPQAINPGERIEANAGRVGIRAAGLGELNEAVLDEIDEIFNEEDGE